MVGKSASCHTTTPVPMYSFEGKWSARDLLQVQIVMFWHAFCGFMPFLMPTAFQSVLGVFFFVWHQHHCQQDQVLSEAKIPKLKGRTEVE